MNTLVLHLPGAGATPVPLPRLTGREPPSQSDRVAPAPPSDSHSFAAFARQHEALLRATALRLCGNPADARDLVQDTIERGLRNLERFQPGTDGRAWLLTILHRLFIDRCRSRTRERRADLSVEEVEERIAAPEVEAAPAWASISPEQLEEALARIPEEFSAVYRLHAIEGRSYIEISGKLGIPKATVGTRLIRARRKLREVLMPSTKENKEAEA